MSTEQSYTRELDALRRFFNSGATLPYEFRRQQLQKLKAAIKKYEQPLHEALYADLKKSPEECWVTETGMLTAEINSALKHLATWMEPERVSTNLVNLPSGSRLHRSPYGVTLIIGPWNYPLQLLFVPLVGAIAAGNAVVLKPSELAPHTAAVMETIIKETFPPEYIWLVQGNGAEVIPAMMNNFRFDYVFFTGSIPVGTAIYKLAAQKLIPVTLELGGKSPCVVESDANIKVAARRIAVTKFSNAGQMCVAPDYVLVHSSVKDKLVAALKSSIAQFYSAQPEDSYSYGKIINQRQFSRLITYLKQGNILHGGRTNEEKLFIEPTLMEGISMDSPIMKDEIFGPILPILTFNTAEEARNIILQNPNPLAFYVFTGSGKKEKSWIESISFGGACVNNASWHLTNHHLPFGGVAQSGIGAYHGQYSFFTFSHTKAVMKTPTWFDPNIKYPPFKGKLGLFKKVIR
jgi:aldehyde dehydrogenase (NAD+)